MAFNIRSYKELISMTKAAFDEALVPLRVRGAKAKAEGEVIKLEEKLIKLETEINTLCAAETPDFVYITSRMDEYELTERRLTQINSLVANLFPSPSVPAAVQNPDVAVNK